AGRQLSNIEESGRFTLSAVTRLGTAQVARNDLVGQSGDILHLVVAADALDELAKRLATTTD
ncbi:MAG: hypothetical protein JHD40_05850, partial [Acidimicrobiia bacterium]|nr:hypothetical protein [Acidimicrobiia bacterium]